MPSIKPIFTLLLAACLLGGCTYHGKLKRNIYRVTDFPEKIDANIMVVNDKYIESHFKMQDPAMPYTTLTIRTDDGVSIAAADALSTLFTEVEVNPRRYQKNYDYVAEIEYTPYTGLTQEQKNYQILEQFVEDNYQYFNQQKFLWVKKVKYPYVVSPVKLTLRNPKTKQAIAVYSATSTTQYDPKWLSDTFGFMTGLSFGLLAPITGPLYAQTAGKDLRVLMQKDLARTLAKIMAEMQQDYMLLTEQEPQQNITRQDEMYRDLMKKIIFLQNEKGSGSGFFVSADGYIITNAHVVEESRDMEMMTYDDFTAQQRGETVTKRYAKVLLINKRRDLALLKATGTFPYFELDADRTHYQTGAEVVAIGAPMGHKWSVSKGIISATRSALSMATEKGAHKKPEADYIQTDAAINHGNSGGPLILVKTGKVVGVNSMGEFMDNANALGFSISAFEVKRTLDINQPIDEDALQNRLIQHKTTLGNVIVD